MLQSCLSYIYLHKDVTLINKTKSTGATTMQDTTKITTPVMDDRNAWRWGFTPQAELWNGRLAAIGFLAAALIEIFSGQGFLHFWGIL